MSVYKVYMIVYCVYTVNCKHRCGSLGIKTNRLKYFIYRPVSVLEYSYCVGSGCSGRIPDILPDIRLIHNQHKASTYQTGLRMRVSILRVCRIPDIWPDIRSIHTQGKTYENHLFDQGTAVPQPDYHHHDDGIPSRCVNGG